jgi:hypothetical protein
VLQRCPKPSNVAAALAAAAAIAAAGALVPPGAGAQEWTPTAARPGYEHDGPCPAAADRLGLASPATFVYRVQQPFDIELFARIRAHRRRDLPAADRDVFLVRARGEKADRAGEMISRLKDESLLSGELFHCNRIATLTGVRTDGEIPDEDVYNVAEDPRLWGIFPDWERPLWQYSYPVAPSWSDDFDTNVRRIRVRAQGIGSRDRQPGVVITGWRYRGPNAWHYGRLAKRAGLRGQIIQTQSECQMSPDQFALRASRLLDQYRRAGVGRSKLAMQVSFAKDPESTSLPHDVTPQRAASCTEAAYAAGVRSFLLWAYPPYLEEYFAALPDYIRH